VRLNNPGSVTWPAGSVTLYESTDVGPLFAGEAQLNVLPPGQSRLIAFGADQKMRIDREFRSRGMVSEIALAKSTLTIKRKIRDTTLYRLANDDTKSRKIVVDHPRPDGSVLVTPAASEVNVSGNTWRLSREVAAGKTEVLEVNVDRPIEQEIAIDDLSRNTLEDALGSSGTPGQGRPDLLLAISQIGIDGAMKDRLQKIAEAADALVAANRRVASLKNDRETIVTDQDRLRDNLKAAPPGSDLAKLETRKLLAQEAQLDGLDVETKTAMSAAASARQNLEDLTGNAISQELMWSNGHTGP
jgi:hypothetical protein